MTDDFSIQPDTKVAALLDHYPELEEVLIAIAPPFKKLRNPLLRKSVAKVASLQQAAAVARIPVLELINTLRTELGIPLLNPQDVQEPESYFKEQPDWFDEKHIVETFDTTQPKDNDDPDTQMTLVPLLQRAVRLENDEIILLITSFLPAPGIDVMKRKGYRVWTHQISPERIHSYFRRGI